MEKFKIKTNVILGNIYARNQHLLDLREKGKKQRAKDGSVYYELIETVTDDGVKQTLTPVPYPITPDYVKSHTSAVDYKKNIAESWNAPAKGVNVGDATSVQALLSKDTEAARALVERLNSAIAEAEKAKTVSPVEPVQEKVTEKVGVENG